AKTKTSACERHVAGAIETSRWWRVITITAAKLTDMKSESAVPATPGWLGPPTIRPTPARATVMAIHVRRLTRSPRNVPSAAARTGEIAWKKRTFATEV